jgi:hypothetical protein
MEANKLKTKKLIVIIFLIATFVVLAGIKKSVKEELYGTWVNPEYEEKKYWYRTAKRVIDPDPNMFSENIKSDIGEPNGSMGYYAQISDTETSHEATISIIEKWTDSEGSVWYKIKYYFYTYHPIGYMLCKISDSGSTLEFMVSDWHFPDFDPSSSEYYIYHRQ